MKALLSILLGLMLLTSFLGISYATPIVNLKPASASNNSCGYQPPNNTSNMNQTQQCHYDHSGHDHDPHNNACTSIPSGPEVSDIQASARVC